MPAAQIDDDADPANQEYVYVDEDDGYDWTGYVYCEEDGLWYDGNADYGDDADWCYDPNA